MAESTTLLTWHPDYIGIEGSNPSLSAFATPKRSYGVTKSAVDTRRRASLKLRRSYGVTKSAVDTRRRASLKLRRSYGVTMSAKNINYAVCLFIKT